MQPTTDSPQATAGTAILLDHAAQDIDPAAYREVAMALVAVDAPVSAAAKLAYAIALSRGPECQRHFIGEYAQLLWESLQDAIEERGQP